MLHYSYIYSSKQKASVRVCVCVCIIYLISSFSKGTLPYGLTDVEDLPTPREFLAPTTLESIVVLLDYRV